MALHPLIADGGEVTILRSLAAYSFGVWNVTWPDSIPEDERPSAGDDRKFGYFADFDRAPGRMGRRFVRNDVNITAREFNDWGSPIPDSGVSNVEEVLDAAINRTAGEAVLEREIDNAGLGGLEPYVDFDVGDIVSIAFWNKVFFLPVTEIALESSVGAARRYRVRVGNSPIFDDDARNRDNSELARMIADERRERRNNERTEAKRRQEALDEEAKARREAMEKEAEARREALEAEARKRSNALVEESRARRQALEREANNRNTAIQNAVSGEAEARKKALEFTNSDVEKVVRFLRGYSSAPDDLVRSLSSINSQLSNQGKSSTNGLVPAYLNLNTELWKAQKKIDDAQTELALANRRAINSLELSRKMHGNALRWNEAQRVRIYHHEGRDTIIHDELLETSAGEGYFDVVARGSWIGRVNVQVELKSMIGGDSAIDMYTFEVTDTSKRRKRFTRGALQMKVNRAHIQISPYVGNDPAEYVFVARDRNRFHSSDYPAGREGGIIHFGAGHVGLFAWRGRGYRFDKPVSFKGTEGKWWDASDVGSVIPPAEYRNGVGVVLVRPAGYKDYPEGEVFTFTEGF
ncbi:hypothetical protein [Corynebacterium minutissimum]|uniref:Immunity-specific protein beta371 n=1 Tax=Corynebacterium minutissimum TaxID=38301 RepID=A0A376CYC1_9CORY|nr:hypothetical protein [Corynebacterium minutissimum]QRP60881.1 hypothetical protein I6J26_12160 [Corynebacterium minutissimum]STC77551.1 immunity-specific protein beta371 [Corynebacterium minutissimum]